MKRSFPGAPSVPGGPPAYSPNTADDYEEENSANYEEGSSAVAPAQTQNVSAPIPAPAGSGGDNDEYNGYESAEEGTTSIAREIFKAKANAFLCSERFSVFTCDRCLQYKFWNI